MGTKRPSWTLFDTLMNISMSDHKLQPGGKVSRDPSPRPAMTVRSEQESDGLREENWRKENEAEKMRDKTRYRDMDAQDRYCEGDRSLGPRLREKEREMWERDKRKEDGRSRNGKLLLNVEKESDRELERRAKKGGTFPRFKKSVSSPDRRLTSVTEMGEERGERRQKDRPKRAEIDAWEQEREQAWQRERERDEVRRRGKEEGKTTGRRYMEHEKVRQRERYQEPDIRFQDNRGEPTFPHRRKELENYANRKESENAQRREKRRDIRSEGHEREVRRERVRDRDGEELMNQYSRSEGDNMGKMAREGDRERERYREREVYRFRWERPEDDHERYRDGDRRPARPANGEGKKSWRYVDDRGERKEDDQYREYKHGRNENRKERQADTKRTDRTGRISRSPTEQAPRVPPRTQSSDPDIEIRSRRDRGRYKEQESRKEGNFERERDRERQRDQELTADKRQIRNERQESDKREKTGSMPEQRRMWLEPQRGKNSKGKFIDGERHTERKEQMGEEEMSMKSQAERGRDGWRIKEEPDERCLEQSSHKRRQGRRNEYREDTEREQEGGSVDEEKVGEIWREKGEKEHLSDSDGGIEESSQTDDEGDVIDDIEEHDREDEGRSDYWARSESEGGSEAGWKKERDEMLSPEDGFESVSSGGEEEREDTEEEFRDSQEFQEGGDQSPAVFKRYERDQKREEEQTMGDEETADREERQPKYVFVAGKALPQSQNSKISPWQVDQIGGVERNDPNLETHHLSGNATQQSQDDLFQTLNRNDDYPVINNQDTESEHQVQREERLSTGEAAEGNIQSRAPSDVHDPESSEEMRSKVKHLFYEMGIMKSDSKTERLLKEWREKNKDLTGKEGVQASFSQSDLDCLQPILDQINSGALSPEEVEAIRIRLSGTWSISEEPKRRSQAPHLRWAKDVVREILGHSEDEPSTEQLDNQPEVNQSEINTKQQEEVAEETKEVPVIKLNVEEEDLEPELDEIFSVRGMGHSQAHMHADQFTVMHVVTHTHTHADTALDSERKEDHSVDIKTSEPSGQVQLGESGIKVTISEAGDNEANLTGREKGEEEEEMFLNADNPLYKPNSCPILYYDSDSDLLCPSSEGESQGVEYGRDESEERRQGEEPEEMGTAVEVTKIVVTEPAEGEGGVESQRQMENLPSSRSLGDLGSSARSQLRGIHITTQRRNVDVEEEEGVGRDRRTRIFYATDDEDARSKSWGEEGLKAYFCTIKKRRKNSKFFSAAQLYQQYSEAAQNFEILRQARSETLSVCEDTTSSPLPSPPPARRPLPPIPPQPYFPSLFHTGSIQSLPLPERPRGERRASSPRLSISQSSSLWRDLPGVSGNAELEQLTDDQRRLQEVRFEVVTSEASYCRSLEIVVNHFVKSKPLGMLLTTQEKNWLFSRLVDVRAISHSFLSKLEEQVDSDVMHFTVCDIITAQCPLFRKAYVPYLTNQSYQDATYQRLMNENPNFKMVVEKIERSAVCQRLPLRSFLVLPFQRITRLKLLVQNIVQRTTPGTEEATQAIKALKQLEKIIQESNDSINQMKSIESLVSLNSKVDFECRTLPLISQSRRLVREGPVTELMEFSLKDKERSVYLHLFNDCLLLSLPKEVGKFTVIDHCLVSELRVENCRVKLHSLKKNLFRLHMTQKSLLLRTDAPSDKARWISALSRPHAEIDFSAAQDFEQMQCIRAFVAQQPDELSLEKADVILVHPESIDSWVEGTRLSDRHRGWVPKSHLETIKSSKVKIRNLLDALKLTAAAKAAV